MDESLVRTLISAADECFARHPILAAYAHGSRISGNPRPASDLDVGSEPLDCLAGASFSVEQVMLLASNLSDRVAIEVDLRHLGDAPLESRGRVLEEGVRIYSGNDVARVALERDTLGRDHDYKDVYRSMHELRLKRIAERGL
jgi:predicted nucleotidyltransferase